MEKKYFTFKATPSKLADQLSFNIESTANWQIFLVLVVVNLLLSWFFQESIMTREVYHLLLSDQLESYRIDKQLELMNRFKIWGYVILPVILWLKFTFVALLLQLPLLLKFIEIPFKKIFRIVMLASFAFVLMNMVYICQLIFLPASEINKNLLKVMPFSLSSLIDISSYPESTIILLSTFNLFEAGWLFLLFFGFIRIAENKLKKIDIALLVIGVWSFILVLHYALLTYMEKAFG